MSERTIITAVVTPGEGGARYQVGDWRGTLSFEEVRYPGVFADIMWIRARFADGSTIDFNMAALESVHREPVNV